MADAFQEALEAEPTEAGPFRTAEQTEARRFERAREASFARVAEETERQIEAERARWNRWRQVARVVTALSMVLALGVLALAATVGRTWVAWSCPALALAISAGLVSLRLGPRRRLPLSGPEDPPEV